MVIEAGFRLRVAAVKSAARAGFSLGESDVSYRTISPAVPSMSEVRRRQQHTARHDGLASLTIVGRSGHVHALVVDNSNTGDGTGFASLELVVEVLLELLCTLRLARTREAGDGDERHGLAVVVSGGDKRKYNQRRVSSLAVDAGQH